MLHQSLKAVPPTDLGACLFFSDPCLASNNPMNPAMRMDGLLPTIPFPCVLCHFMAALSLLQADTAVLYLCHKRTSMDLQTYSLLQVAHDDVGLQAARLKLGQDIHAGFLKSCERVKPRASPLEQSCQGCPTASTAEGCEEGAVPEAASWFRRRKIKSWRRPAHVAMSGSGPARFISPSKSAATTNVWLLEGTEGTKAPSISRLCSFQASRPSEQACRPTCTTRLPAGLTQPRRLQEQRPSERCCSKRHRGMALPVPIKKESTCLMRTANCCTFGCDQAPAACPPAASTRLLTLSYTKEIAGVYPIGFYSIDSALSQPLSPKKCGVSVDPLPK